MKLYILRWNPNMSMAYESHLEYFNQLKEDSVETNWSIHDFEELEEGDIFIFNLVGCGADDGIAGFGTFTSEPYTAPNWKRQDKTNLFYADMKMECLIDRKKTSLFCAAEMESQFPEIDWHSGHAGVLAPEEITEKLILYMMQKLIYIEEPTDTISFFRPFGGSEFNSIFARYINGCCPKTKAKIIESNKLYGKYINEGDTVPLDLIEISDDVFKNVKIDKESSLEDILKLFVPSV